jgi:hypothetical protein
MATTKQIILNQAKSKTHTSPKGRTYNFDWRKEGNKYIFTIAYGGYKMDIKEHDFNRSNIDILLETIERDTKIK